MTTLYERIEAALSGLTEPSEIDDALRGYSNRDVISVVAADVESGGGSPPLEDVLAAGNDAGGLAITNLAEGSDPADAATVSQLGPAVLPTGWTQSGDPADVDAHDGGILNLRVLASTPLNEVPNSDSGGFQFYDEPATSKLHLHFVNSDNFVGFSEFALYDLVDTDRLPMYYAALGDAFSYSGIFYLLTNPAADAPMIGGKLSIFGGEGKGQGASIANASGGATVDAEARTAINALLGYLRVTGGWGLIADPA